MRVGIRVKFVDGLYKDSEGVVTGVTNLPPFIQVRLDNGEWLLCKKDQIIEKEVRQSE